MQKLKENEYRAACRGCHGGCVHILTVEDGKLVGIRPDPEAPLNNGKACTKGISIIEQMYHPERITYPMKRIGERGNGKWERISWDEAYERIAEKLTQLKEESGPECISMLTGTGRHHMAHYWRFSHVLGTPNAASSGPLICLDPRVHSGRWTSGNYCCVDYYGETKPAGIIVWGQNPDVSGPDGELQWQIKDAVCRGTPIIVIDPRSTKLSEVATLNLRIRPGTDGALALGMINFIINNDLYDHDFVDNWCYGLEELKERCAEYTLEKVAKITWLPEEQIIEAVRLITQIKPMSLEWGCALEQSVNAIQTCRAVYILMGITGNYDCPGGFVESQEIAPTASTLEERIPDEMWEKCLNGGIPHLKASHMAHPISVFRAMHDGDPYRIRALLVHANNSMLSMPDSQYVYESLKKLDFMVYMDFFMTPTAEMADIFLPAAFWPEIDEVFCMPEFSEEAILCMQKVVQVGECKCDEEVFLELSKRMGLDYGADSLEDIFNEQLAEMGRRRPEYAGIDLEKFKEIGYIEPKREYYNYKKRGGFNTPSGKFELYSNRMKEIGGDPLPFWSDVAQTLHFSTEHMKKYPLILTSGGRRHQFFISNNRQITSLRTQSPFPLASLNPKTAEEFGINDGDWIFIETPTGRITQKANFDPDMDQRIINCQMGWWYPEAGAPGYGWNESNANVLTNHDVALDPMFGSYPLRGLRCRIYANPDCKIEERFYNSKYYRQLPVDDSSDAIVLDPSKCIVCGTCAWVCGNIQTVGALEVFTSNDRTYVKARNALNMASTMCVGCGQCRANCQEGAIRVKSSVDKVMEALNDPDCVVIASVAPSVRVGISRELGFAPSENVINRLATGLKKAGFYKVHDTTYSADLTIWEECNEFLELVRSGEDRPLFTSCCPAWVQFCEQQYPELAHCISTTRSPQQMLGAVLQDYYKEPERTDGKKPVFVSIMPCTAKKKEIKRPESTTNGKQDIDYVLTTVEIMELLERKGIFLRLCGETLPDEPFSTGSGGGEIFGATGGVTEAALRYLMPQYDMKIKKVIAETGIRGDVPIKITELDFQGIPLRIAVTSGLKNARALLERVKSGEKFNLIEVMACPGGCVMGGGQPANAYTRKQTWKDRTEGLYRSDDSNKWSRSNENTEIIDHEQTFLKGREHELLHRNFKAAEEVSSVQH